MGQDSQAFVTIRKIETHDAETAAQLSHELGYPTSAPEMRKRILTLDGAQDRAVYVACKNDAVVGWIDVGAAHHLQSEPYAEIGGLVVSGQERSAGIGQLLVKAAESWAREQRLGTALVRSNVIREAAHRFYLREGYERTKTSAVFTKALH
jgi:PhnO protein